MVSMVIVLWEVTAILGNGCGIQGQKHVAWLQGNLCYSEGYVKNNRGEMEGLKLLWELSGVVISKLPR